jgi:hypothetical protein
MKNLNEPYKNNPFTVPDNYFEEVNMKIISATSGQDKNIVKPGIYSRFRTRLLIAASIAGFILLSYSALKIFTVHNQESKVSELLKEINSESFINDIDLTILEEDASALVISEQGSGVPGQAIIDYLLLENIEINEIYAKL